MFMFVGIYSMLNYMAYEYNCWFHWCRWGKTHALLIEGGLTYDAIKQSVANASIAFREGVAELFEFLEVSLISNKVFSFSQTLIWDLYDCDTKYSNLSNEKFGLLILDLFCIVIASLANRFMLVIGYLGHSAIF